MNREPDFKNAEKRVFRAFWQDGLLDIFAGASVAVIGIGWACGALTAGLGVPIVAVCLWPLVRRRVTEPRLGTVTFSRWRQREMKHGMVAVASLGVVLFGFVATRLWPDGPHTEFQRWFAPAIPAAILMLLSLSCAEALRLGRFVIHALAFAASGLTVATFELEPWAALLMAGAFVAIWGLIMLIRFTRNFPPLPTEPVTETL